MKKLTGTEIRQMWLDFFASKNHEVIPSASLIPNDDPTLLWINAGVAPLKKYFDGRLKPTNPRMCNAQKSIRTNDIENVGKTARHHTFFEMLGNFSIGDYFREEALTWAFELLTSPKWFDFSPNQLYITYYPNDTVTFNKWVELGMSPDHLIPLEDNFWEIGEGPCGPDTEIFFDRGEKYDPEGLGIKMLKEDIENDRYIEIWNIVFSQYNSKTNLDRSEYPELPSKNIDTGCGLERLACVMQEVDTNYETDLFMPMINYIEDLTGIKYTDQMAFRVIVDHIRSVTFAIADGATLSNEGRGYVLRRILRRAVRYGKKLGIKGLFLYKMVDVVVNNMKAFYPYLLEKQSIIENIVKLEEENFLKTLENGEKKLTELINNLDGKVLKGSDAFLLYDTFGFPLELTIEAASEKGIEVDEKGYHEHLALQKQRARESRVKTQSMNTQVEAYLNFTEKSSFVGYETLSIDSEIIAIFKDGNLVDEANGEVIIVTKETPFYAESGGQISDTGYILINGEEHHILNIFKLPNGQHAHVIETNDLLRVGSIVKLNVNESIRKHTAYNHSATHLLGEALRKVLGNHVVQQGSYVNNKRLRFDFNHFQNLTNNEILKVESIVNDAINAAYQVNVINTTVENAVKLGAQALFGEKYGDTVRLVDMDFSKELCGGTHVSNTADIKKFAILSIESKGSGIFRIEASTNDMINTEIGLSLENLNNDIENLKNKLHSVKANAEKENIEIVTKDIPTFEYVGSYKDMLTKRSEYDFYWNYVKDAEKELNNKLRNKSSEGFDKLGEEFVCLNNIQYLIKKIENVDINVLKDLADKLTLDKENAFVMMSSAKDGKVFFVAKSKNTPHHAGELVKLAAVTAGGNGGGRPDFAQAGGKDESKIEEALQNVKTKLGL